MKTEQLPTLYSRKREWADKAATWGLLGSGLLGTLVGLGDLLTDAVPSLSFLDKASTASPLVLLIISILAISIGLERSATFDVVRKEARYRHSEVIQFINQLQETVEQHNLSLGEEIAEVNQTLAITIGAKSLMGREAVYKEAVRLIKACKGAEVIRATSLGASTRISQDPTPHGIYMKTLAEKIGQVKKKNLDMAYKVVMGFLPNEQGGPPPRKQQSIHRRVNLFRENDALDRLHIRHLETSPWSLDLLIVGDKNIIIGFPTIARNRDVRLGIRITDESFVRNVVRWYDEHLWHEAKDLNWTEEENSS